MTLGQLVAVIGAIELIALLIVLVAGLSVDDPPVRPEREPAEAPPGAAKVEEKVA